MGGGVVAEACLCVLCGATVRWEDVRGEPHCCVWGVACAMACVHRCRSYPAFAPAPISPACLPPPHLSTPPSLPPSLPLPAVSLLPRIDQLWYKYIHMEEMLGNVAGARQIFERWMQWEPDHHGWTAYIKMELRYGEAERARQIYERYVKCLPTGAVRWWGWGSCAVGEGRAWGLCPVLFWFWRELCSLHSYVRVCA